MDDRGERPPIVIADDEPAIRRMLKRMVEACGYRAITAGNGEEALAMCREHRPRLLLVDRDMPPPRYSAISRILRGELGASAPRIVVITGSSDVSSPDLVDGVLAKPFDVADLKLVLAHFASG